MQNCSAFTVIIISSNSLKPFGYPGAITLTIAFIKKIFEGETSPNSTANSVSYTLCEAIVHSIYTTLSVNPYAADG